MRSNGRKVSDIIAAKLRLLGGGGRNAYRSDTGFAGGPLRNTGTVKSYKQKKVI